MKFNPTEHVTSIIKRVPYLTLATANKAGKPWNTPVFSAFDEHFHFFWASAPTSQHSKNINENNQVFAVIYDSSAAEATGEGVYIEGTARELTNKTEIEDALKLLYKRKGHDPKPVDHFMEPHPRRMYEFSPSHFWINRDEKFGGYHVDMRMEVKLP